MVRMRKRVRILPALLTALALAVTFMAATVFAASASLSGPGTVRAGDTITLVLNISDSGKYGIEGNLSYDSGVVTFQSITTSVTGWKAENSGSKFIVYDDEMSKPLSGSTGVAKITFKVNAGVSAGTTVKISVTGLVATDGTNESSLGTASYSISIAKPLSQNNNLSSLKIDGVNLSPAFSKDTLNYNAGEVDYSVSKLNVTAVAEDSSSNVKISGSQLSVGSNTVSIVVTAQNGSSKTYKINVTRKKDPNYVASSNASLSGITLSAGTLSPEFSADIVEYVVYVPHEVKNISAKGTAADSKAQDVTNCDAQLKLGENRISVIGKAEDGTEKKYNITVVVMPEYSGKVPEIEFGADAVHTEEITTEADFESETAAVVNNDNVVNKKSNGAVTIIIVIILMLMSAAGGFGAGYAYKHKGKKHIEPEEL